MYRTRQVIRYWTLHWKIKRWDSHTALTIFSIQEYKNQFFYNTAHKETHNSNYPLSHQSFTLSLKIEQTPPMSPNSLVTHCKLKARISFPLRIFDLTIEETIAPIFSFFLFVLSSFVLPSKSLSHSLLLRSLAIILEISHIEISSTLSG